jgi:hypothetical protein
MSRRRQTCDERPDIVVTIRPLRLSSAEEDRARAKMVALLIDIADRYRNRGAVD